MNTRVFLITGLAIAVLAGCQEFGFEQFDEVTKLRVLSIRVDPPELGPGDIATVDALIVDPRALGDVSYEWEVCAFDTGPDGGYACATDSDGNELGAVVSSDPTAELDYDLLTSFIGSVQELCEAIADADVPEFVELPSCDRGFPITLRLTARTGDGEGDNEEVAVKRVLLLREDVTEPANQNPSIDGLLIEGRAPDAITEVPLREDEPIRLQALIDVADAEPFTDDDEPTTEQLSLSWFSTHGVIERSTTYFFADQVGAAELQTNEIALDEGIEAEIGDEVTVWLVLRDNRGGVDYAEWRMVVTPEN